MSSFTVILHDRAPLMSRSESRNESRSEKERRKKRERENNKGESNRVDGVPMMMALMSWMIKG